MFIDAPTAIQSGLALYEERKKIAGLFSKIWYLIRNGSINLSVFGAGGTGKTTLGLVLSGDFDPQSSSYIYKESVAVEKYGLQGDFVGKLVVPPGQKAREHYWTSLYAALASGKTAGIINVVSWGYHAFQELSYKETEYYNDPMTVGEFMGVYLENRRQRELEIIEDLSHRLKDAPGKIWLVTLVTKQDLWWNNRHEVEEYYTDGPYNDIIF